MTVHECIIIGTGKMGLLHGALIEKSGRGRVSAVIDTSFKSRLIARGMGINAPIQKNFLRALERNSGGVCFVCTPPRSHFQVASTAIENGWNVFVEKPLTMDAKLSHSLARSVEEYGLTGFVGYQKRFSRPFNAFREYISEKNCKVRSIRMKMLSPQFSNSMSSGENRGGVEWDLLPHVVDMAFWIVGIRENKEISDFKIISYGSGEISVEMNKQDCLLHLKADWKSKDARKPELSGEMEFEDGELLVVDEDKLLRISESGFKEALLHQISLYI